MRRDVTPSERSRADAPFRNTNPEGGWVASSFAIAFASFASVASFVSVASFASERGDAGTPAGETAVSPDPGPRRDGAAGNRTFGAPSPSAVAAAALTLRRFALEFGLENSNAARSIAAKWPVGVLDRER